MNHNWSPLARVYDPLKIGSIDGTDIEPHDHGIVRALKSKYKPNQYVVGEPKNTIFIGRLSLKTTEEMVKKEFSGYGRIKRLRLVRDLVTGMSRRYAFVEYDKVADANRAYFEAHEITLDGSIILVDYECERTLEGWVPRRLGGGFGGRKESGQLRFGCRDRPFRKPYNHTFHKRERSKKEAWNETYSFSGTAQQSDRYKSRPGTSYSIPGRRDDARHPGEGRSQRDVQRRHGTTKRTKHEHRA